MSARRVAVVGMGQMGEAMAARLAERGHDVIGYDIHEPTRQRLGAAGVAVTGDLAQALRGREVILTSLPDSAAVRAAWLGDAGIVALADTGSLCIELSTIDPDTMREAGAAATSRGLRVIDCPVSGGPIEARNGTLILIAGGDEALVHEALPFFLDLGDAPHYTGDLGTAKVVKLVNNTMAMGNLLLASECFTVGVAAGVDPARLFHVLSLSGGTSRTLTKRFPKALKGDYSPGFKLELAEKDIGLGVALGRSLKLPMPAATLVHQLFGVALLEGHRGEDAVATLAMYQDWARKAGATGLA
jgi:3-hydroxyisobutyrate dehydrogenase-like beta-hydroxyacid dehydrogenase